MVERGVLHDRSANRIIPETYYRFLVLLDVLGLLDIERSPSIQSVSLEPDLSPYVAQHAVNPIIAAAIYFCS
jgi:hypothetical protein